MRAVVTRVSSASVAIDGETVGEIGTGFLVLLGIGPEDTQAQAEKLADKICGLRVFADQAGKMNLNSVSYTHLNLRRSKTRTTCRRQRRPTRPRRAGGPPGRCAPRHRKSPDSP